MYLKGGCAGIHVGSGQDVKGTEPTRSAKRTRGDQPEESGQL